MVEDPDYYWVLEISPMASDAEIKSAFHRLASLTHPDVDHDDGAGARFQLVVRAYKCLSNADARRRYDATRIKPEERKPEATGSSGVGPGSRDPEPRQAYGSASAKTQTRASETEKPMSPREPADVKSHPLRGHQATHHPNLTSRMFALVAGIAAVTALMVSTGLHAWNRASSVPSFAQGTALSPTSPSTTQPSSDSALDQGAAGQPMPSAPTDHPNAEREIAGTAEAHDRSVVNSLGMKFVRIDPGEFEMGEPFAGDLERQVAESVGQSDWPHRVSITRPFFLATVVTTRALFAIFVRDAGYQTDAEKTGSAFKLQGTDWVEVAGTSWRDPGFPQADDHPVVLVSWNDAMAFCGWLSRKEGKQYRLPTEAEWEYACRAGTTTRYSWGDSEGDARLFCNLRDQSYREKFGADGGVEVAGWSDGFAYTSPVGVFRPNPWGLYDMIGNVSEWCSDWWGDYPRMDVVDPTGPDSGDRRVLRGCDWCFGGLGSITKNRGGSPPKGSSGWIGFRVVQDIGN